MSDTIFFHSQQQELMPVNAKFDNISNLSRYQDNSIGKIIVQDLFDYLLVEDIHNLLPVIYKKLRPLGSLEIQSVDLKQLSLGVAFNDIRISLAQYLLYPHKKSIHTLPELIGMLGSFVIDSKKYVNIFEYYILATKA